MNRKVKLFSLGIIISFIGISLGLYNYIDEKINIAYDTLNQKISSINVEESVEEEIASVVEEVEVEEVEDLEHYIGYIEISKINLSRGFYSKNSPLNSVKTNVYVVSDSTYPDEDNSNLILASHSGNYYNAYFNDLVNLSIGDELIITYKNYKYIYKLDNIYRVQKTGLVKIDRDYNRKTLTLITCTNGVKNSQTVYIAYLSETEEI